MNRFFYIIPLLLSIFHLPLKAQQIDTSAIRDTILPEQTKIKRDTGKIIIGKRKRILSAKEAQEAIVDSLPLLPNTVTIWRLPEDILVDSSNYKVVGNRLEWSSEFWINNPPSQIKIHYKVLPYDLNKNYSHFDTTTIRKVREGEVYIGADYSPYQPKERDWDDLKGLDYGGSFSRGISFGNNQNLVLNSNFNLRMAGTLGDDIEILAAITDQNIPLQAEGNTQQLQEFDRIFIQLKKKQHTFIAGDYELNSPSGYFMQHFKKLQGATYSSQFDFSNNRKLSFRTSAAVSRGKFGRNIFQGQEGNQGPYKLRGNDGERFIIIAAGTEKVFIDGVRMTRGQEDDYIIDYNSGDVIFTPKQLITKDKRIIVEFEYIEQNFTRSIFSANTEYTTDRWGVHLNLYTEQDGRNSSTETLDSLDRISLQNAGDQLDSIAGNGLDTINEFNDFRVRYRQVDTMYVVGNDTLTDQVLVYTTDEVEGRFVASFIQVAPGSGNYVLDNTVAANGRVYRWVAPGPNGPSGDFQPGKRLIAPNQQQLFTLGGYYQLNKNGKLKTEVALSNYDRNRFSSLDDNDNVGMAVNTHIEQTFALGEKEDSWKIQSTLDYEWVDKNFRALNPFRNAEFTRDWNLPQRNLTTERPTEQLFKGGLTLKKKDISFTYELGGLLQDSIYTGIRHESRLLYNKNGFEIDVNGSLLDSESPTEESRFFRPRIDIAKSFSKLKNWKLGLYLEREQNSRKITGSDTLLANSVYWDFYKVYIESPQNEKFQIKSYFLQRYDYAADGTSFAQNTEAKDYALEGNWQQSRASRLSWNITYRQLEILRDDLTTEDPQNTVLGRVEHQLSTANTLLRSTTNYQIESGQEPRVEVIYLKVNKGEGTHIWQDSLYNNDGQLQPNEMAIAPFADQADYVRVVNITDEFIRSNKVQFNYNLTINPKKIWYKKEGILKFFSKFSSRSTLLINRRTRESDEVTAWNPFQLDIPDSSLIATNTTLRNTLFFNRSNPKYDIQLGQADSRNRNALTTGYESRVNQEYKFRFRWNLNKKISWITEATTGTRENDSEFFDERDFNISFQRLQPELSFLPVKDFRAILKYEFLNSENTLGAGNESALQHDFSIELTYNRNATTSLRLSASLVDIDYTGDRNTPIEFAMLQGLRPGQNYLWNLAINRRLSRTIQLSISYDGRKTGVAPIVHVGRAQITASF